MRDIAQTRIEKEENVVPQVILRVKKVYVKRTNKELQATL